MSTLEQALEALLRRVIREELSAALNTDDRLLTAEQVAETLGYTDVHSIYRLKREGKLPAVYVSEKAIRFRQSDVRRFIEECTT